MSIDDRHDIETGSESDDLIRDDALIREIRAIRPRPREGFRRELDDRVAGGFPPRRPGHARGSERSDSPPPRDSRQALGRRLRVPGRFRLGPILAGAAVACAVVTAVVVTDPGSLQSGGEDAVRQNVTSSNAVTGSESMGSSDGSIADDVAGSTAEQPALGAADSAPEESGNRQYEDMAIEPAPRSSSGQTRSIEPMPVPPGASGGPIAADRSQRAVERDASLVLATEPAEVPGVAADVLRVVAGHGGIVLSSSTRGGAEGDAGADFNLKIPSANLSQALAELSDLAVLRDRRENTLDITAPTVSTADRLREARAQVRGLLKQLAEATTEAERTAIQVDLRPAQLRVAELRSRLDRLGRRASYADVRVSIVTGEAGALPEEDEWTIGNAADDAVQILTVLAGIMIVAAAILLPVALIVLLGWIAGRAWIKRSRERALRDDQRSAQGDGSGVRLDP